MEYILVKSHFKDTGLKWYHEVENPINWYN